jgi:hypothetical protein
LLRKQDSPSKLTSVRIDASSGGLLARQQRALPSAL